MAAKEVQKGLSYRRGFGKLMDFLTKPRSLRDLFLEEEVTEEAVELRALNLLRKAKKRIERASRLSCRDDFSFIYHSSPNHAKLYLLEARQLLQGVQACENRVKATAEQIEQMLEEHHQKKEGVGLAVTSLDKHLLTYLQNITGRLNKCLELIDLIVWGLEHATKCDYEKLLVSGKFRKERRYFCPRRSMWGGSIGESDKLGYQRGNRVNFKEINQLQDIVESLEGEVQHLIRLIGKSWMLTKEMPKS